MHKNEITEIDFNEKRIQFMFEDALYELLYDPDNIIELLPEQETMIGEFETLLGDAHAPTWETREPEFKDITEDDICVYIIENFNNAKCIDW